MQTSKKKPSVLFLLLGAILAGYLGYLIGGAWTDGIEFNAFMNRFNEICSAPFANYINEYTVKAVAIAIGVYAMAIVMYYTSQRNMMPGKEFGTAKLESPQRVNKVLMDKDENFNRILSQNVRMSLDFRRLKLNGNILICGGSGAGKTFYEVKPNLMQMPHNCSFICTDPKGEILRSTGDMLKNNGYNVKVINLLEMDKSDCYNPFSYIREETDVVKLITNLISNTTPKGATPSDPFWEKAEGLFLQAIFYYVWLEVKPAKRNFETVLKLLGEAEVTEQGKPSRLDVRMKFLEENNPLGAAHPAVKQYNKCMRGAGDTVRSIIISANSRLAFLENQQVLRLLSKDELSLADIGIGVNGDGETKTALFCVIPDSDKSYNFIIGMLYTQIFQELYYQADFNCGGRLPIHVTFMLDEFANVALPDDYCSLLSTMRSREISSIIIIQNFAQLKALFKDTWETIPGNCDTFIYLGGNEQSTHKYVSELLGKGTIDKKSSGETKGRQGSSSRNYDVLGREIFTPDEVRKLDNKKCIIFIRGFDPILDNKYIPFAHPMFNQTADGKGKPYVHEITSNRNLIGPPFEILSQKAVEHYEKQKEKGDNVFIDDLKYEEFMLLGEVELNHRFTSLEEKEQKEKLNQEQAQELEYSQDTEAEVQQKQELVSKREKPEWEDTITNRMLHWNYTEGQKEELQKAFEAKIPKAVIMEYFYPDVNVVEMRDRFYNA
ncbi:MAG: type IV secretory system conjugative DNA transfer family protein [Anaerostipes sp.]|uniref:VirD4-like conjugal transfer protein, CD1115 family n=1 Tax=Enterocloster bolteae TaxID=208479 RepID=UPI00210D5E91|nr:type IV secretory system conjugative DNA transfer family protein [Enterocloster bolteae]MCQ4756932.1 type IV secretory system conjugative DNA transfer family protein [Enterocloster bolteae]MDD4370720.1 type IV secretory system conjugative DNA transfer family protein [Anaerostipes sp.]